MHVNYFPAIIQLNKITLVASYGLLLFGSKHYLCNTTNMTAHWNVQVVGHGLKKINYQNVYVENIDGCALRKRQGWTFINIDWKKNHLAQSTVYIFSII